MTEKYKEVLDIIKASLWDDYSYEDNISDDLRKELFSHAVIGLASGLLAEDKTVQYYRIARFTRMASLQSLVINTLQAAGISAVIIKGTAAGIYYPKPYLRTYGDIDILVHPNNYLKAIELLRNNGYSQPYNIGKEETVFEKNNIIIELHQAPPGLDRTKKGDFIIKYLLSGLNNIEIGCINEPRCEFPMLPWKQNGLELIWHIREHLYNGLGLRQIIDWMMYISFCQNTNKNINELYIILESSGLLTLAMTVTKMCQMYLGLTGDISWCNDVDNKICEELMDYILEQGDFGHKSNNDKATKVLTKYNTPLSFFKGMQRRGLYRWNESEKNKLLRPFAWIYSLIEGFPILLSKNGRARLAADIRESRNRRRLFRRLYKEDRFDL